MKEKQDTKDNKKPENEKLNNKNFKIDTMEQKSAFHFKVDKKFFIFSSINCSN